LPVLKVTQFFWCDVLLCSDRFALSVPHITTDVFCDIYIHPDANKTDPKSSARGAPLAASLQLDALLSTFDEKHLHFVR